MTEKVSVEQATPAAPPSRSAWLRSGVGMLSAAVALAVGVLTLLFLLRPEWQPRGEAVTRGAELSQPNVEQGVTLAGYYDRQAKPVPAELEADQRSSAGAIVGYDIAIQGYAGESLPVRWSMLEADSRQRVAERWLVDQPGWPIAAYRPESDSDKANGEIWVAVPEREGQFIVRIELFDPDGVRLASVDSEPIPGEPPAPADPAPDSPRPAALPTAPPP